MSISSNCSITPLHIPRFETQSLVPTHTPYGVVSLIEILNDSTIYEDMKLWVAPRSRRTTTGWFKILPLSLMVWGEVKLANEFREISTTGPSSVASMDVRARKRTRLDDKDDEEDDGK
ncbi:hypothetical protein OROGR_010675 [Orobanche gracilis]